MQGRVVIISAPSGAGKSTIIREVMASGFPLEFSVSACSRTMRPGEENGKDYWFLTSDEFREKIEKNEFLEWEEVYKDHYYGTLRSELERIWSKGHHVLIEADVYGGLNIKTQYPDRSMSIFIMPPSVDELRERLIRRSTDEIGSINTRVEKAMEEISLAEKFDVIIVNENINQAVEETKRVIKAFLEKPD
ncbi:MAG: guanylate kinase [Bacteroidetes bacterium]|nr:guanylate kinase [Bacteroidota bacterium]